MKRELAGSEGMSGKKTAPAAAGKTSGIDNLGLLRNVKYYETMYELLAKEYEIAKLDEARDSAIVQVMDKAIEPDRKSRPARSRIVLLSTLVAGLLAVIWVFMREAMVKAMKNPKRLQQLDRLRESLRTGRRSSVV